MLPDDKLRKYGDETWSTQSSNKKRGYTEVSDRLETVNRYDSFQKVNAENTGSDGDDDDEESVFTDSQISAMRKSSTRKKRTSVSCINSSVQKCSVNEAPHYNTAESMNSYTESTNTESETERDDEKKQQSRTITEASIPKLPDATADPEIDKNSTPAATREELGDRGVSTDVETPNPAQGPRGRHHDLEINQIGEMTQILTSGPNPEAIAENLAETADQKPKPPDDNTSTQTDTGNSLMTTLTHDDKSEDQACDDDNAEACVILQIDDDKSTKKITSRIQMINEQIGEHDVSTPKIRGRTAVRVRQVERLSNSRKGSSSTESRSASCNSQRYNPY